MKNSIPDGAEYLLDEYDAERFWSKVIFSGGQEYLKDPICHLGADAGDCWTWRERPKSDSYAAFIRHGVNEPSHRVAYQDFGNRIEVGQVIDHLCRNTACVRPSHLQAVTHQANMGRGITANKTHCSNGHEFTLANTKTSGTRRLCMICRRAWAKNARQKLKQTA